MQACWLLSGLLLCLGWVPCQLPAQTNATKAAPSNRCLLIVDTSRSMQRRIDATVKVVQDLVVSGLEGQLRRGDTIGLWTFDNALHAGRFPLQTWSPDGRQEVAARTLTFLKAQKFGKQPRFDKVLPALSNIVERSERLTVILISSGEETVRGTPYDRQITAFYRKWHDAQQKARMPFVTVLRAQNGRLVDCALNTPPWPLQLPVPPEVAKTTEAVRDRLQQALQGRALGSNLPPQSAVGKEPQPEGTPTANPKAPSVNAGAPVPAAAAGGTNRPAEFKPPVLSGPPVQVAKLETAPAVSNLVPTQLVSKPTAAPVPVVEPKPEAVKSPLQGPVGPVIPKPEAAPLLPTPAAQSKPAGAVPPKPSPGVQPKATLVSTPPPSLAGPPATGASATVTMSAAPRPVSVAAPASPRSTPPAQTATATPAENLVSRNLFWIAALAVVIAAGAFGLLRLRRSRAAPQGSLITRSYERTKKP